MLLYEKKYLSEINKSRVKIFQKYKDFEKEVEKLRSERDNINALLRTLNPEDDADEIAKLTKELYKIRNDLRSKNSKLIQLKKRAEDEYQKRKTELRKQRDKDSEKHQAVLMSKNLKSKSDDYLNSRKELLSSIHNRSKKQNIELMAIKWQTNLRERAVKTKKSKEESDTAKIVDILENNNFAKFIRHPLDAINKGIKNNIMRPMFGNVGEKFKKSKAGQLINKASITKKALGVFFKGSIIGKIGGLIFGPISKSLGKIISKIFPYKGIVDFLLSPAGITVMLTIYTLFKNFIWNPIIKPIIDNVIKPAWKFIKKGLGLLWKFEKWWFKTLIKGFKFIVSGIKFLIGGPSKGKESLLGWMNIYIVKPLHNAWIKTKGFFIGIMNKIIEFINNKIIVPLREVTIFKHKPFAGLSTISPIGKNGDIDLSNSPANTVQKSMENSVNYMETKTKAVAVGAYRKKEEEQQKQALETQGILDAIEVSNINKNTQSSVVNNNNVSSVSVTVPEKQLDESPVGYGDFALTGAFANI